MVRRAYQGLISLIAVMAVAAVCSPAEAVTATLTVSPTGGYVPLGVNATNTVTLESQGSEWTEADFYFEPLGGPHIDPTVVIPADDSGGTASVGVVLSPYTGTWITYVIDKGIDPDNDPWYVSANGPDVTVVHQF